MDNELYHSDYSSVSRTMLSLFRQSPWEFYLTYECEPPQLAPWKPTAPALKGTVLHSIMLDDCELDDLVLPYPEECFNFDRETEQRSNALNGKRAAAFREDHPDQLCLKASEYADIANAVKSVMAHKQLRAVLDAATHREQRFDAVLDGIQCKCKPDIAVDIGSSIVLYDLKFSKKVDPQSWRRLSKRCGLWLQDAHYSRCMSQAFDKPVTFRFWNIEIEPPYRVQPYWYDQNGRAESQMEHRRLLLALHERRQSEHPPEIAWSDGWDSVCVVDPWLFENELTDEVQV